MLRQFSCRALLVAGLVVAVASSMPGCGIKGPLRPAPKAWPAAAAPPPPIDNPAIPPATTSPALPPPATPPERKP